VQSPIPGRWTFWLAKQFYSAHTCTAIIEPMIADLQAEWVSIDSAWRRRARLITGYAAVWCTLFWCGARAVVVPRRWALKTRLAWLYWLGLFALVGAAHWVRSGEWSWAAITDGVYRGWPLLFWAGLALREWPGPLARAIDSARLKLLYTIGFIIATVVAGWLPGPWWGILLVTSVVLSNSFNLMKKRQRESKNRLSIRP
jgi:hypothetical protein